MFGRSTLVCSLAISCAVFSARAAVSPQEVAEAMGGHPAIAWNWSESSQWSLENQRLTLRSNGQGTHFIQATVSGPGVMELKAPDLDVSNLEALIFVDGVQSGGRTTGFPTRVQVPAGSHTVRWQVQNLSYRIGQPTVTRLSPVVWDPYVESPLQVAGVSEGAVTLSGEWIGQNRSHHGDGSAAWSGIQVSTLPGETLVYPVLRADFSGEGVFTYQAKVTDGYGSFRINGGSWSNIYSQDPWHRKVTRFDPGVHSIEWKVSKSQSFQRVAGDMVIDEIRFSPEVPLADALDTPGWIWSGLESAEGRPFGTENPEANGGGSVILPTGSEISSTLPEAGMLQIRFRGYQPRVSLGGEEVGLEIVADPASSDDWQIGAVVVPAANTPVRVFAPSGSEVDSIVVIRPPSSVADVLGLPGEGFSLGGQAVWQVAPRTRLGKYVVELQVDEGAESGWLEFPVTGPAEVSIDFDANYVRENLEFLVDGKRVWDGEASYPDSVVIEIPEGSHVLRCVGRMGWHEDDFRITDLKVSPLPPGGKIAAALDMAQPWGSSGDWRVDSVLSSDGVDSLRPLPPANPSHALAETTHTLRAPVDGPGYFSFRTYVGESPDASYSSAIGWSSNVHPNAYRHHSDDEKGWLQETLWFPPGRHWLRWQSTGTAHDLSLVAIDDVLFAASEVLSFDEVVGASDVVWKNDPQRPWTGVRKESGAEPVIVSQTLDGDDETRLEATVQGPGEIRFRWRNGGNGWINGEFRINGKQHEAYLPWGDQDEEWIIPIPSSGEVKLEWIYESSHDGNWVEMENVVWTPSPVIPLAEALDAGPGVTWETGSGNPFTGGPDAAAKNGSAARVEIAPGEEAWLDAVVDGPGVFDFWLRDVPGADNAGSEVEWELLIDGETSHIQDWQMTWPVQWILSDGPHRIRLKFTNPESSQKSLFVGVDDVLWKPLVRRHEEGWTSGGSAGPDVFQTGGRDDEPQVVLPLQTGESRWVEKAVTGPGTLVWSERVTYGAYTQSSRVVTIDGVCVIPEQYDQDEWLTYRLHFPEGGHTVRWSTEPYLFDGETYEKRSDSIWQISGMTYLPGLPGLMTAIEDSANVWLAIGHENGEAVTGNESHDGIDAWSMGDETVLYLCNVGDEGLMAGGMVYQTDFESGAAGWKETTRWAGPGEIVEWVSARSFGYGIYVPPCIIDSFVAESIATVPLHEALDIGEEILSEDWVGLKNGGGAFDGIDSGWSRVTELYQKNTATFSVQSPARVSFRWKSSGNGKLGVLVNGAWLPVGEPGEEWKEVEFEVADTSELKWVHSAVWETLADAPGDAWIDMLTITPVPVRSLDDVVSAGSGLHFASANSSGNGQPWRSAGYRDRNGVWREAARSIASAEELRTSVTGPAIVSFRAYCADVTVPDPVVLSKSVIVVGAWPGMQVDGHYLGVKVGDREVLRLTKEETSGWQEHRFHVPAGEHVVSWRIDDIVRYGYPPENPVPAGQAWVTGVSVKNPRADYDEWASGSLAGNTKTDPKEDADGDGQINYLEYAYSTNPDDASSRPPEMFGSMLRSAYRLHIPRLPAHVPGVLMTSEDLVNWMPSSIRLRSSPFLSTGFLFPVIGGDFDSGIHQVIEFDATAGKRSKFFRIDLTPP